MTDVVTRLVELLDTLGIVAEIENSLEDLFGEESKGPSDLYPHPFLTGAKKAEQHWPTTARATSDRPQWPPFEGIRTELGGERGQ